MYGASWPSWVVSKSWRRNTLSVGTPSERARAMLSVARSSGRPSRLLRSVSTMNSSISLPGWSDIPIRMPPAAFSEVSVAPLASRLNSGGLRKPSSSGREYCRPALSLRAMVSVSIEWPKR